MVEEAGDSGAQRVERGAAHRVDVLQAVDRAIPRRARVAGVGPALVIRDERLGLRVIDREALLHGVLAVVVALHERLAGLVVEARPAWRVEPHVIGCLLYTSDAADERSSV